MSRHRNVRSMRYSDEYDGYDDVYGHSVEDDYSISPSDAAFMYDRSNQQQQLSSYVRTEEDIAEEDEGFIKENLSNNLNDLDRAKLLSCLDELRNVLGDSLPEQLLIEASIESHFDSAVALDKLLNSTSSKQKEQDVEVPKPQRTNARPRGRGGRKGQVLKNHSPKDDLRQLGHLGSGDSIPFFLDCPPVFNVEMFLKSDKTNVDLNLYDAIATKNIVTESRSASAVIDASAVDPVNANNDSNEEMVKDNNMFVLRNMTIQELRKEGPSMFGYFVCKKLVEFNSKAIIKMGSIITSDKIIPFDFNCNSPDDVGLSNRRWKV